MSRLSDGGEEAISITRHKAVGMDRAEEQYEVAAEGCRSELAPDAGG
jgi:hypothetical protein